jgi:hypothetical protein
VLGCNGHYAMVYKHMFDKFRQVGSTYGDDYAGHREARIYDKANDHQTQAGDGWIAHYEDRRQHAA